ncbi:MAG TPA: urea ABC transporter permease subunit UrtB, partial [Rhodospirillales bacterium]|nr:urea ABC transporter permease subunit UrtB [Rhodospirillales bacterium]
MPPALRHLLLRLMLACSLFACAGAGAATADDLAALVDRLGSNDFAAKAQAIDAIAASGDERAERVLAAMMAGDLQARRDDGRMVIAEQKGQVFVLSDPLTGAEIGEATRGELRQATINNRLRAQLRGALGALTLLSPDAAK